MSIDRDQHLSSGTHARPQRDLDDQLHDEEHDGPSRAAQDHALHRERDKRVAQATPSSPSPKAAAARSSDKESLDAGAATIMTYAAGVDYLSEQIELTLTHPPNAVSRSVITDSFNGVVRQMKALTDYCAALGLDTTMWKSRQDALDVMEAALTRFDRNLTKALDTYAPTVYELKLDTIKLAHQAGAWSTLTGSTAGVVALAHEPSTRPQAHNAQLRQSVPEIVEAVAATAMSIAAGNRAHLPRLVQLLTELNEEYIFLYFNDRGSFPAFKKHFNNALTSIMNQVNGISWVAADKGYVTQRDALIDSLKKHP